MDAEEQQMFFREMAILAELNHGEFFLVRFIISWVHHLFAPWYI